MRKLLNLFQGRTLYAEAGRALWNCLKSGVRLFRPALVGLALWIGLYWTLALSGFEYRGTAMVLGAFLCAWSVRGNLRTSIKGAAVGVLGYFGIILAPHWTDVVFNRGYQIETFLDVSLLTPREQFTKWHVVAGAASFLCFLIPQKHTSSQTWLERYRWVTGAFFTDAMTLAASLREFREKPDKGVIDFGMLPAGARLPSEWATKNFLLSGIIGCGKTTYLKKLMASVLSGLEHGSNQRALIYDLKGEFYPFLLALGLKAPVRIVNPLDSRCAWWDLASEVGSTKVAYQIAAALVPNPASEQAARDGHFFTMKARSVLAGLMISFQRHSPGRWTLTDVCLALRDRKRYEAILQRDSDTGSIVSSLEHADTRGDVMATLDQYRWRYEIIAALWDRAMQNGNPSFTVRSWLEGSEVLLLTQDKSGGELLNPIYQSLLHTLAEQVASQPNDDRRRTWLFFDEFHTLGRVPLIGELLNTCRTRGASTVIGIQDVEQLREVYGNHGSNVILGALKCKAVFQSSAEHAKWAQEIFGKAEYFVERKSWSSTVTSSQSGGSSSATLNTGTSREQVPLFRSEFFTFLPPPTPENGFHAAFMLDGMAYAGEQPFFEAIHSIPNPLDVEGYMPAPAECQTLADWEPADYRRLNLVLEHSTTEAATPPGKGKRPPITIKR